MLTRLKAYLHELASDKKNWLILLPAISAFNHIFAMFRKVAIDDYIAGIVILVVTFLFKLTHPYSYIIFCFLMFLMSIYWLFFLPKIRWASLPFLLFWFFWAGFIYTKVTDPTAD
jgi:hypothetical protein